MALERLRCQQGEWKTRDHFSNRQLQKYDRDARIGRATPQKTGIRCTEHVDKPLQEATCKGPCGRRRDIQFFSKRTIRHETYWCVECTDWKLRTETGESLPAPGAQLSAEEIVRPSTNRVALDAYDADLDDVASSVGMEDDYSENTSTVGVTESIPETESVYGNWSDGGMIPMHLEQAQTRAPHCLLGGRLTGSSQLATSTVDSTSVASGNMDSSAERGVRRAVPFNSWDPNGEYGRMGKARTAASESTRTGVATRSEPVKQNKSGWAKVPSRKHAPQLPDYLKSETAGMDYNQGRRSGYDSDGLDLGSDSDIYAD